MQIYIEPHGCALSYGEAELMQELAEEKGFRVVATPNEADILVLHTCIVIESTERKMYTKIKELRSYRKPLIVSGCLPSVYPNSVLEIAPESTLLPAQQLQKFQTILEGFTIVSSRQSLLPRKRIISTVPIAIGCLGSCSFCITKLARGELKSRAVEDVMEHVRSYLEQGAKEVRLAAQDTACYGVDIDSSLPELVNKITALPYEFRLRIGMMNVNTALPILKDLISCYSSEKVYKFLHLPLQSGSQKILDRMNRTYSVEDFVKVASEFRRRYPNLTLSTDVIIGFPSETEEDYLATLNLIKKLKFDIVNIKAFSPRRGTRAFYLKPRTQSRIVKARTRELSALRLSVSRENFEKYVGSKQRILVTELGKNNTVIGRTSCYKSVALKETIDLGKFVDAEITKAESTYLIGKLTNAEETK